MKGCGSSLPNQFFPCSTVVPLSKYYLPNDQQILCRLYEYQINQLLKNGAFFRHANSQNCAAFRQTNRHHKNSYCTFRGELQSIGWLSANSSGCASKCRDVFFLNGRCKKRANTGIGPLNNRTCQPVKELAMKLTKYAENVCYVQMKLT